MDVSPLLCKPTPAYIRALMYGEGMERIGRRHLHVYCVIIMVMSVFTFNISNSLTVL